MFALFFSLYCAMFTGTWQNYTYADLFNVNYGLTTKMISVFNALGKFLTSIFNDSATTFDTFGNDIYYESIYLVSFVLALITSIGIVVMAVKGVKKAFGIFFMGLRR